MIVNKVPSLSKTHWLAMLSFLGGDKLGDLSSKSGSMWVLPTMILRIPLSDREIPVGILKGILKVSKTSLHGV